jgi:hypothetical protein
MADTSGNRADFARGRVLPSSGLQPGFFLIPEHMETSSPLDGCDMFFFLYSRLSQEGRPVHPKRNRDRRGGWQSQ